MVPSIHRSRDADRPPATAGAREAREVTEPAHHLRRVLLLQSVDDAVAKTRLRRIAQNPRLRAYQFAPAYAVTFTDAERAAGDLCRDHVQDAPLIAQIDAQIRHFGPDILFVQVGIVFRRFPDDLLQVLERVHAQHPHLLLGIERRDWLGMPEAIGRRLATTRVFAETPEMALLRHEIF